MSDPLVDFVVKQAGENPRVYELVQDVRDFEALKAQPGWKRLHEKLAQRRQRFTSMLGRRLVAGEDVSQREIDFERGFLAGAEFIVELPEKADENLERAARQAWLVAQSARKDTK